MRGFLRAALLVGLCGTVPACSSDRGEPVVDEAASLSPQTSAFPSTYARQWMTNLANSVKFDGISPPVAARTYAYGAIAIYESVVHGMPGAQSLAGQLHGLDALPQPDPTLDYDWPTVLAATMGVVALATYVFPERIFFEFTTPAQASLQSLSVTQIGYRRAAGVPENVIGNSIAFGQQLGGAIAQWANSDGYAQARYKGWIPPAGPDKWVPTGFSDTDKVANPLEPAFGTLRPLVLNPGECDPPGPPPFSTDPSSTFFAEALAVQQVETNLTDEQLEIARFWADGPRDTPTPAGHWLAITTQIVRPMTLDKAAEAYARVAMGFYEAFVSCWKAKYQHNLLRPETYIRRHIQADWRPVLPTPQFPSYTSGHSTQSAASAVLLTDLFGSGPFTDNTKLRRGFGSRSFANFTAAAQEATASRFYAGIHYNFDDNDGFNQGTCIGNAIVSRVQMAP